MRRVAFLSCSTLLLLTLAGCKQNEGDRCNLDSDCAEGLICCVQLNKASTFREGTCRPAGKCENIPTDTGVPDLLKSDAKVDGKAADAKVDGAKPDLPAADKAVTPDTKPAADTKPAPDTKPTPDATPAVDTKAGG